MAWRRTRQRPLHGVAVGMEAHTLLRGQRCSQFGIEGVATRYTVAGGKWSDVAEIIVTARSPHETMPLAPDPICCRYDAGSSRANCRRHRSRVPVTRYSNATPRNR